MKKLSIKYGRCKKWSIIENEWFSSSHVPENKRCQEKHPCCIRKYGHIGKHHAHSNEECVTIWTRTRTYRWNGCF